MSSQLPVQFADLEPFAGEWVRATEKERYQKRASASWEEIVAFNDAMIPRLGEICAYIEQVPYGPVDGLDRERKNLLFLAMSSMEAGMAVDFWKCPDPQDVFPGNRLAALDLPRPESLPATSA